MLLIKRQQDIKHFLGYYLRTEKPHTSIRHLFKELENRGLYSHIHVIFSDDEITSTSTIIVQPNGVIVWSEMDSFDNVVENCLRYIQEKGENSPVCLKLCSNLPIHQEKKKKEMLLKGSTIGQYAVLVRTLEREEKMKYKDTYNWKEENEMYIKNRINSVLDRYNEQKVMYELFHDESYYRNMERWKRQFERLVKNEFSEYE